MFKTLLPLISLVLATLALSPQWTTDFGDVPIRIFEEDGLVVVVGSSGRVVVYSIEGDEIASFDVGEELNGADLNKGKLALLARDSIIVYSISGRELIRVPLDEEFSGAVYFSSPYLIVADKYLGLFYLSFTDPPELYLIRGFKGLYQVLPACLVQAGNNVLLADAPGKLYLLTPSLKLLDSLKLKGPAYSLSYCSGRVLVGGDKEVYLIEVDSKLKESGAVKVDSPAIVAFNADCSRFAAGTEKAVIIFDSKSLNEVDEAKAGRVTAISWKGLLVVGTREGKVMAFKAEAKAQSLYGNYTEVITTVTIPIEILGTTVTVTKAIVVKVPVVTTTSKVNSTLPSLS